jgi:hypothetical protein
MVAVSLTLLFVLGWSSLTTANLASHQRRHHHKAKGISHSEEPALLDTRVDVTEANSPPVLVPVDATGETATGGPDDDSAAEPNNSTKTITSRSSGSWWVSNGSGKGKHVVAHFIVGNAYVRSVCFGDASHLTHHTLKSSLIHLPNGHLRPGWQRPKECMC